MKHIIATHIVYWPNVGFYPAAVVGNYMRLVADSHKEQIRIKNWQRIPAWVEGLEITALPANQQLGWIERNEDSEDGYNYNYSSRWMAN